MQLFCFICFCRLEFGFCECWRDTRIGRVERTRKNRCFGFGFESSRLRLEPVPNPHRKRGGDHATLRASIRFTDPSSSPRIREALPFRRLRNSGRARSYGPRFPSCSGRGPLCRERSLCESNPRGPCCPSPHCNGEVRSEFHGGFPVRALRHGG